MLAQWRRLVASLKAINLLNWVILAVSYRCIAIAIETASKVGVFCIVITASKVGVFCIVILLIVALAAAWAICSE